MCLILFSYDHHPKYRLIVAANRDEFYDRPTTPLSFWDDYPEVLAGRDLEKKGTWMGVSKSGRFAALTNYRDPTSVKANARSRGELVSRFLTEDIPADLYMREVKRISDEFNDFNLLVFDTRKLLYYSSIEMQIVEVEPGFHGLSNALLNTPWPKVVKGTEGMKPCIQRTVDVDRECLFQLLSDSDRAKDEELPDTGVGLERERMLSPLFITSPHYGTRSSTVLTLDFNGLVEIRERNFLNGKEGGEERSFIFQVVKE